MAVVVGSGIPAAMRCTFRWVQVITFDDSTPSAARASSDQGLAAPLTPIST